MEAAKIDHTLRWLGFIAAAWLGGCAVAPEVVETVPPEESRARQALATGNFRQAAEWWQEAALVTVGPQSEEYRLRAAEAWFEARDMPNTRSQLQRVDESQLGTAVRSRFALLHADIALTEADAQRAEFYLEAARENLPPEQRPRYQGLMDRVVSLSTDPGSYAIAAAASALNSRSIYDVNQGVAILQLLEDIPSSTLHGITDLTAGSHGLSGWPELAVLMRHALVNGESLLETASGWSLAHPAHEVTEAGFLELAERYRQLFSLPSNVAVLLPEAGGLAAAGKAIRDGLVSSFLESGENVSLRFYPTSSDPQSAVSAYFEALGEGAQWIIGPLRKESVRTMMELGSLSLPMLALNNLDDAAGQQWEGNLVFGLSLSQEQEAHAIARRALANGWKSVIMLSSNDPWGQRMESAFSNEFQAGGGSITASAAFEPAENDHSPLLTSLLKIDESTERKNRLQATLGMNLKFEPARRDDFDLFFLAANPDQGRQLRPQLKFHDAGGKPVMAMGRIYDGSENRAANQDLNDVVFPSTRWQLETQAGLGEDSLSSLRGGSLASLYALGIDAWQLLPWLPLMKKDPDLSFPGQVGELTMDRDGQLLRKPAWARFSRGQAQEVAWPDDVSVEHFD